MRSAGDSAQAKACATPATEVTVRRAAENSLLIQFQPALNNFAKSFDATQGRRKANPIEMTTVTVASRGDCMRS